MTTIKKLLNQPIDHLDAEVLLAHVLKKSRVDIFVRTDTFVHKAQTQKFQRLVKKRQAGWPVAYLTNEKEFFGLKFYVDKNVLVPRPETEGLVELALAKIKDQKSKIKILDIGTGSGCIIISLAKSLFAYSRELDHEYFASDISTAALKVARKNARLHKVHISFKQSDILEGWPARHLPDTLSLSRRAGASDKSSKQGVAGGKNQHFDIIVANLPYLASLSDPSTQFEPKQALIAQKKGLALIEKLFKQIAWINNSPQPPLNLRGGGPDLSGPGALLPKYVFLEIGHDQGTKIKNLAKKFLPGFDTKISKDLFGQARYAVLSWKQAHLL